MIERSARVADADWHRVPGLMTCARSGNVIARAAYRGAKVDELEEALDYIEKIQEMFGP